MATEDKMNVKERFQYRQMMKGRYEQADRKTRERLLDEMEVDEKLLQKLARVSISTVRRIVQRVQPEGSRLPRARQGRRSDSAAQMLVPVSVIPWNEPSPGYFEVDLAHHSRSGMDGDFTCTIQFIDVSTGRSEQSTIKGHTFVVMCHAFPTFGWVLKASLAF